MNSLKFPPIIFVLILAGCIPFFQNCSSGGGSSGSPVDNANNPGAGGLTEGYFPANSSLVQWFTMSDKSAFPTNDNSKSTYYFGLTNDKDKNFYAVGSTNISLDGNTLVGTYDALITKYSQHNKKLWTKTLGKAGKTTSWQMGIAGKKDSSLYVTGNTNADYNGTLNGKNDCIVAKYDENGNQQWILQFGVAAVNATCTGRDIALDSSENIYVAGIIFGGSGNSWNLAGATNSGGKGRHLLVAKISPSGSLISAFATGDNSASPYVHTSARLVINPTSDDIYAVSYVTRSGLPAGDYYNDFVMVKLDSNLSLVWQTNTNGGNYTITADAIAIDSNGNPWIGGFTDDNLGGFSNPKKDLSPRTVNGFVAKIDPLHGSVDSVNYMLNSSVASNGAVTKVDAIAFDDTNAMHIAGQSPEHNGQTLPTHTLFYKKVDGAGNTISHKQEDGTCSLTTPRTNLVINGGSIYQAGYLNAYLSGQYCGITVPSYNGVILQFK